MEDVLVNLSEPDDYGGTRSTRLLGDPETTYPAFSPLGGSDLFGGLYYASSARCLIGLSAWQWAPDML